MFAGSGLGRRLKYVRRHQATCWPFRPGNDDLRRRIPPPTASSRASRVTETGEWVVGESVRKGAWGAVIFDLTKQIYLVTTTQSNRKQDDKKII